MFTKIGTQMGGRNGGMEGQREEGMLLEKT